jgi:hypothetical protein
LKNEKKCEVSLGSIYSVKIHVDLNCAEESLADNSIDSELLSQLVKALKVLANEKRGGLRVLSFDRPPFKL